MNRKKKQTQQEDSGQQEPQRNKLLLYLAFGMTAVGAVMAVVVTIIMFMPSYQISWSTLFLDPLTYVLIGGIILVTAGFILQRVITPPMEFDEYEQIRSRLE
jgi:hypothetical protein